MLSLETESKLVTLISKIIECEKLVEKSRQELCSNPNFDPYAVFTMINSSKNGKIDLTEIKNFLSRRNVSITRLHLELLISQYDSNLDGMLSLDEFQTLVLPCQNLDLREETLTRNVKAPSLYVESTLARHIGLEANLQGNLQTFKRDLFSQSDFSPIDIFRALDKQKLNCISVYNIRDFLIKKGLQVTFKDVDAFIRRVSTDSDFKVEYEEFVSGILPVKRPYSASMSKRVQTTPCRKTKSRASNRSPFRLSKTNAGKLFSNTNDFKSTKSKNFNYTSPGDMQEIIDVFSTQIDIENDIEKAKVAVCKHSDFNIIDMFRMIDTENKNYIDCSDIEQLLRELQIPYHVDEIYLLLKHYGDDFKLTVNDIEHMYLPRNSFYFNSIKLRRPRYSEDRIRVFSADTLNDIIFFFKLQLRSENFAETLRKKIASKTWINLYDIFKDIDSDKDELISALDLKSLFSEFNFVCSDDDIYRLIQRYEKSQNKAFSYPKFIQELTPKLFN